MPRAASPRAATGARSRGEDRERAGGEPSVARAVRGRGAARWRSRWREARRLPCRRRGHARACEDPRTHRVHVARPRDGWRRAHDVRTGCIRRAAVGPTDFWFIPRCIWICIPEGTCKIGREFGPLATKSSPLPPSHFPPLRRGRNSPHHRNPLSLPLVAGKSARRAEGALLFGADDLSSNRACFSPLVLA